MDKKDDLMALAARLRAAERRGAGTAGRPYPMALRRRVVDAAQDRRAAGGSLKEVAEAVGVSGVTIWAWTRQDGPGALRRVRLSDSQPESDMGTRAAAAADGEAEGTPFGSGVRVTGPGGLQIDGLSIAGLADLVRRLS